ncbi:MAG: glycosyltransferase [bacterium]|nr:glycosyltransferase [bacterium]
MKFSIVTPVYNGEKYIAETIESVLSQKGDFEIEYIIADGASTDKTIEVIKSYASRVNMGQYPIYCKKVTLQWFSEKDRGMYDAIEKGFARATGDVMAYINADDKYFPEAFATVAGILVQYPDIEWVKGINTTSNERGDIIAQGSCFLYRQDWLQKGIYGRNAYFVQQDSVFWRRSLWKRARLHISSLRLAGDYALWTAFALHTPLWSFNKRVSVFRERAGQLSGTMEESYRQEQEAIAPHNFFIEKKVMSFFLLQRFLKLNQKNIITRTMFFILFPFCKQQWYIDFDTRGNPIKKKALSYIV